MADERVETESNEEVETELSADQVFPDGDDYQEEATGDKAEESEKSDDSTESEETETDDKDEKSEESEASTPDEDKKDEPWHLKAVMDEREKRQAAQKELEELRKKYETKDENKKSTSVFEDEDGFRNELLQELESSRWNDKLNMSQALAEREFGSDVVAEKVTAFKELAEKNPDIRNRFAQAALPYHEMINIVEQHEKAKEIENVDEFREKIRAEEREKLRKELEDQQGKQDKKREAITPSLASRRSKGGTSEPVSIESLEDVLND